jgi:DNA polymerase-3 subunit epsilon
MTNGDYTHISLARFRAELYQQPYLILDTETTGLHEGEIVQIAIIDHHKRILLDTLVKPSCKIPDDAYRIHGISDEMVANAPTWAEISTLVYDIIRDKNLIVYSAAYDRRMMHQSAKAAQLPKIDWRNHARWFCAMTVFAELYGEWNDYHRSYRWQRLSTAASYFNAGVMNAHTALGDCLMTHAVVEGMLKDGGEPVTMESIPW